MPRSPRRLLVLAALVGLCLWTGLQGARETRRALVLAADDPWRDDTPELWTVESGAVARLDALAERVRGALPEQATLAVTPAASLTWRGDYVVFWLAFLMPERSIRPAGTAADVLAADYWLSWPAPGAPGTERGPQVPPWRVETVLHSDGARLQRVLPPPAPTPPGPSPP